MALAEKSLERMLKAQKEALEKAKAPAKATPPPAAPERTDLFEEYQKPDLKDHPRTGKGLNALGYKFPPEPPASTPAMTKANMAKGIGLPSPVPAAPPAPSPSELVEKDPLFEEYQRPDLKDHPRHGKGIRHAPEPKTAKEILQGFDPSEPHKVVTPRRTPPPPPLPAPPAAAASEL